MSKTAKELPLGEPQEVIGGGLSPGVVRQLIAREKLISETQKTREHLLFFNSNGAWARLASSINTLSEEEVNELTQAKKSVQEVKGDSTLAWNNVLMGGTLKQSETNEVTSMGGGVSEKLHRPIELSDTGYIRAGGAMDAKDSAYHNYESLGFRPTPGIESVSVQSKGTYGTLRTGEVKIKVWTLEDLEVMQALYLRPGYTMLLEWGHSLQLSEQGEVIKEIPVYKKFLYDDIQDPMYTFEKDLATLVEDSSYNYDSFVGYVSNFDWSLNADGGYDCTVKLIGKGSVIESIAVTFDTSTVYPADQMNSTRTDKGKEERKSIYHKLFTEMQYWVDGNTLGSTITQVGAAGLIASASPITALGLLANIDVMGEVSDTLLGNEEEELSNLNTPLGQEAIIASENDAFTQKLSRVVDGDNFTFGGESFSFNSTSPIAGLGQEELIYYLTSNFGKYGLQFEQGEVRGAANIVVSVIGENNRSQRIKLNSTYDKQNRVESLKLANFIQDNSKLPESELTEEQKADRERRKAIAKQNEIDRKNSEAIAKESNANITGLDPEGEIMPIYTKENFLKDSSQHFKQTLNDFVAFRLKNLEKKDTGFVDNDNLNEFWIPLAVVLDVFNNYVTLIDATQEKSRGTNSQGRKLTQFYTGWQDEDTTGDYEKKVKYLTTDLHFSINPMVCVLPKRPSLIILQDSKGNEVEWPDEQGTSFPMGVIWKNGFHQQVESAFQQGILRGQPDDILNILLPVQLIKDELDKITKENEDSDQNGINNAVSFLKTLLRGMNEAMGGINDFDLFYEDRDDLYYIVDRKVTPVSIEFIPTLSLSGNKSTMLDVSISSQISQNIGNMVSIAAQGTGGNSKDNVSTLLKWNAGLIDRHIRHKSQDKNPSTVDQIEEERESPADKRQQKWIEDYYDYWREFNGDKFWDNGDFNESAVTNLAAYHKRFCQKYVVEAYSKKKEDPKPPAGVIPVELSFKTLGIGGLKIGQAFRIDQGLLPQRYAEEFGYIITGLSHSVADSKWTTDVKTQFYYIKKPSKEDLQLFNSNNKVSSTKFKNPNVPEGAREGEIIGEDIAPIINPNRVGSEKPDKSAVAKELLANGITNGNLPADLLVNIGGGYKLHPKAAATYNKWKIDIIAAGLSPMLVSGYRSLESQKATASKFKNQPGRAAAPGTSAHGFGIAVDLSMNVPSASTSPANNLNKRRTERYKTIASLGVKHGWYNPWRLSDNRGSDESWHFEYWGE